MQLTNVTKPQTNSMTKKETPTVPKPDKNWINCSLGNHFKILLNQNKTQKSRKTSPNQNFLFLRKGHNQNKKEKNK